MANAYENPLYEKFKNSTGGRPRKPISFEGYLYSMVIDHWLTSDEVEDYFGVDPSILHRLHAIGYLEGKLMGDDWCWPASGIRKLQTQYENMHPDGGEGIG